jgi:subtilase family serine protease
LGTQTAHRGLARILKVTVLQFAVVVLVASLASAQGNLRILKGSTPGFVSLGLNLGAEDPGTQITVSVWLKRHNEAAFQELLRQMYTKGSPHYQQWLTMEQYAANFGPSAADVATVSDFLKAHNLNVSETDKYNQYVTAEGSVADVQNAFHVQINRFSLMQETHRANAGDVSIEGPAGALVAAVLGLDDIAATPYVSQVKDPQTGQPSPPVPIELASTSFESLCWKGSVNQDFLGPWPLYYPQAFYSGNEYVGGLGGNKPPCAYTPAQVQHAYGLDVVYQNGYRGEGQEIMIVDAYGSPTLWGDAVHFASYFGLRNALGGIANYQFQAANPDWNLETTLDVEYANAIADGADIQVLLTPNGTLTSLLWGLWEAISAYSENQISLSWGVPEGYVSNSDLNLIDQDLSTAASMGISVNVASGDCGDFVSGSKCTTGVAQVSAPASDPWATGVGGTSMFTNSVGVILFQTGWGNNTTQIAQHRRQRVVPVDPPSPNGFLWGSGGGDSRYWPAPAGYPIDGSGKRRVPDIAYLADPYTGVQVIHTDNFDPNNSGNYVTEAVGGTSLAAPMFSALWAITNQWMLRNGFLTVSLGVAARQMYRLGTLGMASAITDILAGSSPIDVSANNVSGTIYHTLRRRHDYSADDLAAPLNGTTKYASAFWKPDYWPSNSYVLTFGTDSSLRTGTGWDNVTGLGTPNGWHFVTAFPPLVTCVIPC